MAKDQYDDKSKPNVKSVVNFMLDGEVVRVGDVVSKKAFPNKSDWQNLVNMEPARAEETADKVGKVKPAKKTTAKKADALPG